MKWPQWPWWSTRRSGRWTSSGWQGRCARRWGARRERSTTSVPRRYPAWRPRTVWTSRCASQRSMKPGRSGSSPRSASVAAPSHGTGWSIRAGRSAASWCSPRRRVRGGATYTCAGKATRTAVTLFCSATTCVPIRLPDGSGGAFKQRLARSVPDLLDYGQIKAPATEILMIAAERWAAATGWQPPPGRPASRTSPAR